MTSDSLIILVAPNVSEQMGGEGLKALHIFREVKKAHKNVVQITHGRNWAELHDRLALPDVEFVADTTISVILWKSVFLRWLLDPLFSKQAVTLAESIAQRRGVSGAAVIIHQSEPNSPVAWRATSRRHLNIFGPINGNIYYPELFRRYESLSAKIRRLLHFPLQRLNRLLPGGIKKADLILYAGGERTRKSLLAAGCAENGLVSTADCGVPEGLLDRPRIEHHDVNFRFVHFGRLVFHKCTFLIIESLAKTQSRICLDVIGRGPQLEYCKQLTEELKLGDRVRFLGWYTSHADLLEALSQYRGVVLPSIEDANGMVVQESMALGLPPICLDWGGPQLLIEDGVSGYLISPTSRENITTNIARCLDALANDGALAESMSVAARMRANTWCWPKLIRAWLDDYPVMRRDAEDSK